VQVQERRLLGRFFTPAKVAEALARTTLAGLGGSVRLLDPACGEGALLLAAGQELGRRARLEGWEKERPVLDAARRALEGSELRAKLHVRDALFEGQGPFDAVIANPPWVSFSGREHVALPPAERERLRQRFASFRGWPSLQGPFLERALELVRPGGRVGFVLPRQVLELEKYAPLRSIVSARATILEVRDLGEGVFDGVTEPAATLVLEVASSTVAGQGAPISCRAELPRWAQRILERLERFPRFPRGLVSDPGVHTGNAASLVLSKEPRAGFAPCREGRDVSAFELAPPRIFVRESPELADPFYARVPRAERFREVAIVLRQTANRPIAARHAPWARFRNSVLAVSAGAFPVEHLLALLNSRLFALAHRARFADARQRAFPQVKVGALAALPFVERTCERLLALVRRRERGATEDASLETAVCGLFGVDEDATRALLGWSP
jgi:hypothetical protein